MPHLLTLMLRLLDIFGTPWGKMPHIDTRSYFSFPKISFTIGQHFRHLRYIWDRLVAISGHLSQYFGSYGHFKILKKTFSFFQKSIFHKTSSSLSISLSIKIIFFAQKLPKMSLFHYSWAKNDISTKMFFSCPIY